MGSGSSPASPKPPSKGRYICNVNPTHYISWEMWHEQFKFKETDPPGRCGNCSRDESCTLGRFVWVPAVGIPDANAPAFKPPDMEEFINGVGKAH